MVIPWNALGVVGGAIVFIYDRTKDRRAKMKAEAGKVPPAPTFENGAADVALFATYRGPGETVRHFDEDIKPGLLAQLDARGLRHVPASELTSSPEEAAALAQLGSFYMVTPLAEGQVSAGETVRTCQESGGVVLGSLSLIALPVAPDAYPMLLAIGGAQLEKSANAAGEFAVLSKWSEPAKEKAAEVVPADEHGIVDDAVVPDVALQESMAQKNGAAKSEPKTVLANIFDAAKEESR